MALEISTKIENNDNLCFITIHLPKLNIDIKVNDIRFLVDNIMFFFRIERFLLGGFQSLNSQSWERSPTIV